jgi:hypothetical protein
MVARDNDALAAADGAAWRRVLEWVRLLTSVAKESPAAASALELAATVLAATPLEEATLPQFMLGVEMLLRVAMEPVELPIGAGVLRAALVAARDVFVSLGVTTDGAVHAVLEPLLTALFRAVAGGARVRWFLDGMDADAMVHAPSWPEGDTVGAWAPDVPERDRLRQGRRVVDAVLDLVLAICDMPRRLLDVVRGAAPFILSTVRAVVAVGTGDSPGALGARALFASVGRLLQALRAARVDEDGGMPLLAMLCVVKGAEAADEPGRPRRRRSAGADRRRPGRVVALGGREKPDSEDDDDERSAASEPTDDDADARLVVAMDRFGRARRAGSPKLPRARVPIDSDGDDSDDGDRRASPVAQAYRVVDRRAAPAAAPPKAAAARLKKAPSSDESDDVVGRLGLFVDEDVERRVPAKAAAA